DVASEASVVECVDEVVEGGSEVEQAVAGDESSPLAVEWGKVDVEAVLKAVGLRLCGDAIVVSPRDLGDVPGGFRCEGLQVLLCALPLCPCTVEASCHALTPSRSFPESQR